MVHSLFFILYWKHRPYNSCTSFVWPSEFCVSFLYSWIDVFRVLENEPHMKASILNTDWDLNRLGPYRNLPGHWRGGVRPTFEWRFCRIPGHCCRPRRCRCPCSWAAPPTRRGPSRCASARGRCCAASWWRGSWTCRWRWTRLRGPHPTQTTRPAGTALLVGTRGASIMCTRGPPPAALWWLAWLDVSCSPMKLILQGSSQLRAHRISWNVE